MSSITEFVPGIRYVGVNDRTKSLFEGLWPLPQGVSYNSYLIIDRKTALIDTADGAFTDRFLANIEQALEGRRLDYLVINHMEPDHSASIAAVRRSHPEVTLVSNAKALAMVEGYYGICDAVLEVKEGDTLSLGERSLLFRMTPMVHWPETMMSYCPEEKILFSGDAFGCFGALDGGITDRDMDTDRYWDEMVRYYSNIVGKYGSPVQKALEKWKGTELRAICPTHGPVWTEQLPRVAELYDRMSRYECEPGVVIAYGSMYGNTEQMAEELARRFAARGIRRIAVHNLSVSHVSYVLRDIFKYRALVVGSPTYNGGIYPPVAALLEQIGERNLPPRPFACFGSFTWAGTAARRIAAWAEGVKWPVCAAPVEFRQGYDRAKAAGCDALVEAVLAQME